MKVTGMIFAAGIGSRLRPITDTIPKALVEVGGVPMLQRTLMRMRDAGIDDVVINVHHHACKIIDFLADNDNFGMNIAVSDESDKLLDTGGGLLKAAELIGDTDAVVLHNADVYTDIALRQLIEMFADKGCDVVLAVNQRDTSRYLLADSLGRMRGWTNVTTGEVKPASLTADTAATYNRVGFCGIHVVRKSVVMPQLQAYGESHGDKFSLTPFYVDICDRIDIRCQSVAADSVWIDIGKPATLEQARRLALKR